MRCQWLRACVRACVAYGPTHAAPTSQNRSRIDPALPVQELWPKLQAEVRGMLDGSGVSDQYARDVEMFMWHVFGVHGRKPELWFAARDMVRNLQQNQQQQLAGLTDIRDALVCFMTGSL